MHESARTSPINYIILNYSSKIDPHSYFRLIAINIVLIQQSTKRKFEKPVLKANLDGKIWTLVSTLLNFVSLFLSALVTSGL